MPKPYVIGVDLGGTKICTALANSSGKILQIAKIPTDAAAGQTKVIKNLLTSIEMVLDKQKAKLSQIKVIGVGMPGPVNSDKGIVESPPNLPGWKKVNLRNILQQKLKCKVLLENDANLAALAEGRRGAGKGVKNFVYITVSTGIGGGIVIDGKIYKGESGAAGEVGHFIVDQGGNRCGCGNLGCLEAMASGVAMRKMAIQRLNERYSKILELVDGEIEKVDAAIIAQAAKAGDALAKEIIGEVVEILAKGFAGIVNILNPKLLVIGGGLSNMGPLLFDPLNKLVKKHSLPSAARVVAVVRAKLGDQAGVIGAVELCL